MRAYHLARSGDGGAGLSLRQDPIPTPGRGEILVRIRATSLSFRERMIPRGDYVLPVEPDIGPLSDGAGEIVSVGEGAERYRVGDRVAANVFPSWHSGPLDIQTAGRAGFHRALIAHDHAERQKRRIAHQRERCTSSACGCS